jgi:hypothetical protein
MHEVDLSENNFKDFETTTRSSVCALDWDISFHDDDNDGCRNVRVQVNGLTGDCADCTITSYDLSLNSNDVITTYDKATQTWPSTGILPIGQWSLDLTINRFRYKGVPGNLTTLLSTITYTSSAQNMFLVKLGNGEIVDFNFVHGIAYDVELCANMTIDCNGSATTMSFCELIDLGCS